MTFHQNLTSPRLVAPSGPVTRALHAMRLAETLPDDVVRFPGDDEEATIEALREGFRLQIEADLARAERLIAALDLLDGDIDREADYSNCVQAPGGRIFTSTLSADHEPSLCGCGHHERDGNWPSWPRDLVGCNDDGDDLEADDSELEENGDDEPSLGSLNLTFGSSLVETIDGLARTDCTSQIAWAAGSSDDGEVGDDNGIADHGGAAEQFGYSGLVRGGVL